MIQQKWAKMHFLHCCRQWRQWVFIWCKKYIPTCLFLVFHKGSFITYFIMWVVEDLSDISLAKMLSGILLIFCRLTTKIFINYKNLLIHCFFFLSPFSLKYFNDFTYKHKRGFLPVPNILLQYSKKGPDIFFDVEIKYHTNSIPLTHAIVKTESFMLKGFEL